MPQVRRSASLAANTTVTLDLAPFDRFAGGGGQATVAAVGTGGNPGDLELDVLLGSDIVAQDYAVPVAAGGVTNETPGISGIGAPADPITVRVENTTAGALVYDVLVSIINA